MKFIYTKIMILLGVLISIPAFSADTIKVFNADAKPIQTPFYAESITDFRPSSKKFKPYYDRMIIWYQNPEHYRTAVSDFPRKGMTIIQVRSGDTVFINMNQHNHHKQDWYAFPLSWVSDGSLEVIFAERAMKTPTLLGIEGLHGIQVQHWRGRLAGKYSTKKDVMDIWMSTDERIPVIVKSKTVDPKGTATWELANLRVGESMPDYILKSQMSPSIGIMNQLRSQYKPLWMTLILHILDLLSYVLLILSIVAVRLGYKRILLIVSYGFIGLILSRYPSGLGPYMNQYSGLPTIILIGVMMAAIIIHSLRRFPIPGSPGFFAGTRWTIAIWIVIVAGYGLLMGENQTSAAYGDPYIYFHFFLPSLINAIAFYIPSAAIEEVVFRGYLTGALSQRFTSGRIVNVLQSLAFTAVHIPGLIHNFNNYPVFIRNIVSLFILGLIFGGLRLKYKNLGASCLVHAIYNMCLDYGVTLVVYAAITNPLK